MTSAQKAPPPSRRLIFGGLAAFILLAPAMPQLLGVYAPIFRPWIMFSGVGLGLLRGDFTVTRGDEATHLTPLDFIGFDQYRLAMTLNQPYLVFDETGLAAKINAYCAAHPAVTEVAFQGETALADGWRALSLSVACDK